MTLPSLPLAWLNAQFTDNDGEPLASGKVYFYAANTVTPKDTFTTALRAVANANPVILDSSGRATIFLESGGYDVEIKTSADVLVRTITDVEDTPLSFFTGLGTTMTGGSKDVADGYVFDNDDYLVTSDAAATGTPNATLMAADERVAAEGNGLPLTFLNQSAVDWTLTTNGSDTINGTAGAFTVPDGAWVQLLSDGSSAWYALLSSAGA